ncbi:iron-containing alcohol dehydrogenase family protein [Desulfurispirillum indicum]|uniref:iron-containing alcohol dehydrogenase family protein n=1 Tax=Desulfurispirillum indicum TaxID=936456 RepID=UPI001CF9681A|nr:iron-containing alcohol dehydrogenase family protein [Desulfurispirillum indicum]UCZ56897.1 iron-containing alcohol dehydrogenase family protein [Desulfurispirillum indicum]
MSSTSITIPGLVRIKPGALERLGIYCQRQGFGRVAIVMSADLPTALTSALKSSLESADIHILFRQEAAEPDFDEARDIFAALPSQADAIIGFGGGKALDVAKFAAALARKPYLSVPTSLSNDSFASPAVSLLLRGAKRSLNATMPFGVIIDTQVCLGAPRQLWHSGVGDLSAKLTAVRDWKLAFHATGEKVNDFAALLSDATVFQFLARPAHDLQGVRLLGTALMQSGIAMEICGSSRPASGSEHLISHALDRMAPQQHLHGIQVGVATYIVAHLQRNEHLCALARLFEHTGFWESAARCGLNRQQWQEAVALAPRIKPNFHTILSQRDWWPEIAHLLEHDPWLRACFA